MRFVYTPKHCSWLNQVEIWFGVLARKVLKRGNFTSAKDLGEKMGMFIDYFNRTHAIFVKNDELNAFLSWKLTVKMALP